MDYVGECSVCEDIVEESEAGYCKSCGCAFHWGCCGSWYGGEHTCENCMNDIEEESN